MHFLLYFVLFLFIYRLFQLYFRSKCKPDFGRATVWITGASSGLGEHLAYKFVHYNAKAIILTARRVSELERVKENCLKIRKEVSIILLPLDLSKPETVAKESQEFFEQNGLRVDILVNNAGLSQRGKFEQMQHSDNVFMYNVNVFSPIELARLVVEKHFALKGMILNIASVSGKFGTAGRTAYCSSKHALISYFDGLRAGYAESSVQVTNVLPGYIKTNLDKGAMVGGGESYQKTDENIQGGMEPEAVANVAVKSLYRGEPEVWICEPKIKVLISLRNVLPELSFWFLGRYKTVTLKKED
jgi:short-subunit dehydrogenase